jgi:transposase
MPPSYISLAAIGITRYRIPRVDERAWLTNRLQAVLEDANSKLAAVVTDVRGLAAREILQRLLEVLSGG